jgi:hypothetical protein
MGRFRESYQRKLEAYRKRHSVELAASIPIYRDDCIPPKGTAVTISLSKGRIALIDLEDEPLVRQFSWHARMNEYGHWYAYRDTKIGGKRKRISMHRFIMGVTDPKIPVDHKNGDGLDNRRSENLRICTNTQNIRNSRAHIDKKDSKLKGVYFNREVGKSRGMFGEFARCNFPAPEVATSLPVAAVSR